MSKKRKNITLSSKSHQKCQMKPKAIKKPVASLITLLLPKILLEALCYQMSSQVIYVNVTLKVMRCVWHESPRLAKKFAADKTTM